jgi:hypothetical protein
MLWHYTVWMTSYVICYYMLCKSLHTSCYNRVLCHLSSVSHYYIEWNDVRHNHVIFPYRVCTYTLSKVTFIWGGIKQWRMCLYHGMSWKYHNKRTRYKKTQHKIESPIMGKRADLKQIWIGLPVSMQPKARMPFLGCSTEVQKSVLVVSLGRLELAPYTEANSNVERVGLSTYCRFESTQWYQLLYESLRDIVGFRPPKWCSGVRYCIAALEASLQTWVRSQAVSQPGLTRRTMRRRTIGPASSGLGEGLAGWDVLVPSRSSNSLWQAGSLHTDFGRQLYSVSSNTLVWLASGLSDQCVKKLCCLAGSCFGGRMALDLRLSRVCMGVTTMGQDCNYHLGVKS